MSLALIHYGCFCVKFFTKLETSLRVWRIWHVNAFPVPWMRIYHYVVVTAALVSIVSLASSLSLMALFSLLDQLAELCHVNLRRAGHLIRSSPILKVLASESFTPSLSCVSLYFSLMNLPVLRALRMTNGWRVSKRVSLLLFIYFAHFVWEIIMEFKWDPPPRRLMKDPVGTETFLSFKGTCQGKWKLADIAFYDWYWYSSFCFDLFNKWLWVYTENIFFTFWQN